MTIIELVTRLEKNRVRLSSDGEELIVRGEKAMLDSSLVAELRRNKNALLQSIRTGEYVRLIGELVGLSLNAGDIRRITSRIEGGPGNLQDLYPLAPFQEGILFHHLMGGEGDPYLSSLLFSVDTRQRVESYVEALRAVMRRHDILRTAVLWEGLSQPVQVVYRQVDLPVEEVELEASGGEAAKQLYGRFNPRDYRIDLRQAPLLRVYIARDEENDRWLMLQLVHHIIDDNTALRILQEEIEAHLQGEGEGLPAVQPFRNLVAQARLGVSGEEHERFFRKLLGDVEEPTAPYGLLDVQGDGRGIEEARQRVEGELGRRIREQARRLGVSAASVCHVAWGQVLARVSGARTWCSGRCCSGGCRGERERTVEWVRSSTRCRCG